MRKILITGAADLLDIICQVFAQRWCDNFRLITLIITMTQVKSKDKKIKV